MSFKDQLIKTICVIFVDNQFMSKYAFHIQNPPTDLLHLLIG